MAHINRVRVIAADPKAVWDVLADFGAISSWVDDVDHSCMLTSGNDPVGSARRVQVGRNVLVETISTCDPPAELAYRIEGLPRRLGRLTNRWTLQPLGTGTEVTLTSTVDGAGPLAAVTERIVIRVMAKQSDSMLAGLARRLESRHD